MQKDKKKNINFEFSNKLPPQNLEAEEGILSACLLFPESCDEVADLLLPEHFYRSAHQKIFNVILELHRTRSPIDLVTVSNLLRQKGELEACGGATYLATLTETVPAAQNITHYAGILRDKAAKRLTINKCQKISETCFNDSIPAAEIIDGAQADILSIETSSPGTVSYRTMNEIMLDCVDRLDERFRNKGKLTGVPTGFSLVDEMLWGLQKTDLIIVAARPSLGKSSFCLNIARHAAIDQDPPYPVGMFSLEMNREQLGFKWMADLAKIDTQRFKSGYFSRHDWTRLTDAAGQLSSAPIFIDDSSGLTITEVRRRSRQMKKKNDIQLLIIDYMQLMVGKGREQNREREIAEISVGLKGLAKDLEIPVIGISQLNRKVEDRNDKRPRLSDLRESGSVEQDADVVMFIYRDEVYNKDENNPHRGTAEIIVAKNRTGPIGSARLAFRKELASFYNLATRPEDEMY